MRQFRALLAPLAQAGDLRLLSLSGESVPHLLAGQCAYLRIADSYDPYLRRPYFPLVRGAAGEAMPLALLLPAADPLVAAPGEIGVDALAPVGNGFALGEGTRRLLLVGDVARLAPLLSLAHHAALAQVAVTLLVQSDPGAALRDFVGSLLPLAVEYRLAQQVAPMLAAHLSWCDQVCVAGDAALTHDVRAAVVANTLPAVQGFAQALVATGAGCGFGVCLGCAVTMARGTRLACTDGPVFDLLALSTAPV